MRSTCITVVSLLLLSALAAGIHSLFVDPPVPDPADLAYRVTLNEAAALTDAIWVDARTTSEFDAAHYPGAIHLNFDNWDAATIDLLMVWDPSQPLVVYCDAATCQTSKELAQRLREDFASESVYWLENGWEAIQAAGVPVE